MQISCIILSAFFSVLWDFLSCLLSLLVIMHSIHFDCLTFSLLQSHISCLPEGFESLQLSMSHCQLVFNIDPMFISLIAKGERRSSQAVQKHCDFWQWNEILSSSVLSLCWSYLSAVNTTQALNCLKLKINL